MLIVLLTAMQATATVRTQDEALRIAAAFTADTGAWQGHNAAFKHRSNTLRTPFDIVDSTATYYAVNVHEGFVLVGADDRLPEVIGYGDTGRFDADNIAPALRYWLQCYAEELEAVPEVGSRMPETRISSSNAVAPLLSCTWNQSAPFNNLAPQYNTTGSRSASGCVATAMAQIMYYYKYPVQGTGSHSYLWACTATPSLSRTLSANFAATTYDWSNMLDSYKSGYTTVQGEAVATLMYHCGVAVDMGYGASSGAYTATVPVALRDYFGYDANYQRIQKVLYPADSLNAIVYQELAAKRPVLVSGSNDEGGHAFVCDGCDSRGYYHINWGWGGSNDGYYLLTALNPGKSQGIGGTTKGYNQGTSFYIGLQPKSNTSATAIPQMGMDNMTIDKQSFARSTGSFDVTITKLQNFGLTDFSGYYGVALYDEDETELINVISMSGSYSLNAGHYRTTAATMSNIKIPSYLPAGTYHLCVVYKDANYDWMRLMCTQDDYYRTLTLTSTTATFYSNDAAPELSLSAPVSFGEGVNTDSIPVTGIPVSFAVTNTGGTFRGQISARIYKGAFSKGQYEIIDSVVIRRNQTLNSALQQTFDPALLLNTEYKMRVCYRTGSTDSWHDLTPSANNSIPFKLYDPNFHLSLTEAIHFDNNDSVPCNDANLHYSIQNTGAAFAGDIRLYFYSGSFSRGQSEIRAVSIATGETITGAFSGPLEQPAGTYTIYLRYRPTDGEWTDFADLGVIDATVVTPEPEVFAYSDVICGSPAAYQGYGFAIDAADLPRAGKDSTYQRLSQIAGSCRDSLVTLTLETTPVDTVDQQPLSLTVRQLPYVADAYLTVPDDTPAGSHEFVVAIDDCLSYRYAVTITDDVGTEVESQPTDISASPVLLMRMALYDLYLMPSRNTEGVQYHKVFIPVK